MRAQVLANMTLEALHDRKRSLQGVRGYDNTKAIARVDREIRRRGKVASCGHASPTIWYDGLCNGCHQRALNA